jgi:hypothetical protein
MMHAGLRERRSMGLDRRARLPACKILRATVSFMAPKNSQMALICGVVCSLSVTACPGDDGGGGKDETTTTETGEVTTTGPSPTTGLPTTGETTTETTLATTGETTAATGETTAATTGETGETTGGPAAMLPATYRFDCLDIIDLGDGDNPRDGEPDGMAFQALLLENTWAADIEELRLNILHTVLARDAAAGTAQMLIRSGVGTEIGNLCAEPTTVSEPITGGFDAAVAQWQPVATAGACAEPAPGGASGFGGTYELQLGAEDTIYVYAREQADEGGDVLNCVPGGGAPDAVPLHAIRATLTVDENEEIAAGELTGCLMDSEAQALCSCMGECSGSSGPGCGECPDGSVRLATLLAGVGPTDNCTELMGETAYDMRVRFTAQRLAVEEPMLCEE